METIRAAGNTDQMAMRKCIAICVLQTDADLTGSCGNPSGTGRSVF